MALQAGQDGILRGIASVVRITVVSPIVSILLRRERANVAMAIPWLYSLWLYYGCTHYGYTHYGCTHYGYTILRSVRSMAILTVAILTVTILTVTILTMARLTMGRLTTAVPLLTYYGHILVGEHRAQRAQLQKDRQARAYVSQCRPSEWPESQRCRDVRLAVGTCA